ncbi:NADH dehydrogenase [Lampropedia hyalina DSM 16112]|jgi:NADH dehydrogenase|uniref:NADH:ubiquinone reductase (non-electrogenic) n=1 Tax=Lampropedia hyalina DSM 16112 TaxID=1122156 RepID=A0A1M4S8M5_9BURK|nr:NAD(P)/FAD-dependent oxidoreductase [Lampropedia hyalina]SHE28573.1 NADH dehydrogenase [Lampropedia hyalina DSM 16112]
MAKPRIIIVGGGFGGLEVTKALRHADVDILLINNTNHHLFQPLLYQVATAGLAAPSIGAPIRSLMRARKNISTILGEVVDVLPASREVVLSNGLYYGYDYLIVATGATHSYFGNDAWQAHAPGMKTLRDAFTIRSKITHAFENAEIEPDPVKRAAYLTFAVIGAGPTGVEMAGSMAEIARHTLRGEFRHIDPSRARILLIEGGPRVLQSMPDKLSQRALEQLDRLGVQVMLNARVTHIDEDGLDVEHLNPAPPASTGQNGKPHAPRTERIPSQCVIWAAGVAASPLGKTLAKATGAQTDRAGRVIVNPDLTVASDERIFVIGDLASAQSHRAGQPPQPVPGVSPAAKQMGQLAADNILRHLKGQASRQFVYTNYGNLATIGRLAAVVDLPLWRGKHLRMSGMLAWQFWLFAHIYFLIGFRNRFVVLMDWASAYWTFNRSARVVAEGEQKPATPPSET